MAPTVQVGDSILAAKSAYGYTRYSLPFSIPLFQGHIRTVEPQHGDVVVFHMPRDDAFYIKRIVGLPGDRVQMIDGALYLNEKPVQRERIDDLVVTDAAGRSVTARGWRETLPNGVSYVTLDLVDYGYADNTPVYTVPAGRYFMLGDNRDNSTDSRFLANFGYIPFDDIIGRAAIVYASKEPSLKGQPSPVRYERIGQLIR